MLCQLCKQKDATVHLTQIVEDEMKKLDLCESCAKQKGVNDPTGFSLAELLLGASGGEPGATAEVKPGAMAAEPRCVRCGMTQTEFKKSGRMGCSDCYNTFSDSLEGLLKGMHKGTKHRGKIPASIKTTLDQQETLDRLSARLQAAIAAEDFEQAAQVRDEIKAIKAAA